MFRSPSAYMVDRALRAGMTRPAISPLSSRELDWDPSDRPTREEREEKRASRQLRKALRESTRLIATSSRKSGKTLQQELAAYEFVSNMAGASVETPGGTGVVALEDIIGMYEKVLTQGFVPDQIAVSIETAVAWGLITQQQYFEYKYGAEFIDEEADAAARLALALELVDVSVDPYAAREV